MGAAAGQGASPARSPNRRPGARPSATQASARKTIAPRIGRGASTAAATASRRGRPSSTSPTTLTKQNTASPAVAAERGERDRAGHPVAEVPVRGDVQQRLQRQPLRREAVQRRQARDRHRADEERAAGPRHPPEQAAEPVELERAHRSLERACAEEEQRLEHGVVQRVQERGAERERGPGVRTARPQDEAGAEAEHDDPDVLDRVQREEPLQVVLEERVDDAADGRERTEAEHEHAEPRRQHADPVDEDAHEPVDRDLDHHAAHQRRDGRGRDRMRARQPDVQRHQAGLRAHPDQRGERDRDLQARAGADRLRAPDRAGLREQQDRDPGRRPRRGA